MCVGLCHSGNWASVMFDIGEFVAARFGPKITLFRGISHRDVGYVCAVNDSATAGAASIGRRLEVPYSGVATVVPFGKGRSGLTVSNEMIAVREGSLRITPRPYISCQQETQSSEFPPRTSQIKKGRRA
jgi:hypothetical protein